MKPIAKQIIMLAFVLMSCNAYAQSQWDGSSFISPSGGAVPLSTSQPCGCELGLGSFVEPPSAGMPVDPTISSISVWSYDPSQPSPTGDGAVGTAGYMDINDFARQTTVTSNQAAIAQLQKDNDRAFQGTALSAALVTTQPKAEDRFSLSLNAAGFESETGVGLSFGFAPTEHFMFHIGHARASDSHLTRGGISASF